MEGCPKHRRDTVEEKSGITLGCGALLGEENVVIVVVSGDDRLDINDCARQCEGDIGKKG